MGTAEGEENEPLVPILAVGGQQSVPLTASVELNGVPVTMEVDTGVTVSLMSEQKQRQLFPQVLLEKPTVPYYVYHGVNQSSGADDSTGQVPQLRWEAYFVCSTREYPHTPRSRMAAAYTPILEEPGGGVRA